MHSPHCTQIAMKQEPDRNNTSWCQDGYQLGYIRAPMMCVNVKRIPVTQLSRTFNFLYILGFQSRASSSVYPPRPGRPASPGGLGIFATSESVEESESDNSEESDPDESERSEAGGESEGVESQVERLGRLNVTWVRRE